MSPKTRATIEDLYKVEGKAELVNGEIVHMAPTGGLPGRASGRAYQSLSGYEQRVGGGYAFPNNVAFAVKLPHRESFSPDASWYVGPPPDMRFPQGAPIFAVEVRTHTTTGEPPSELCETNALIISPVVPSLSGMWTCKART